MAVIAANGIRVAPPQGWEAQLRTLESSTPTEEGPELRAAAVLDERERVRRRAPRTNLHVANFALPAERGDFGGGAVELMGLRHAFVSLVEYEDNLAGVGLFAREGVPRRIRPEEFDPQALQRTITGQAGLQRFFTADGRAFCLYVVLGGHRMARVITPAINEVLETIEVG